MVHIKKMSQIEQNLKNISLKISAACTLNGQKIRDAGDVNVVAVSKKQPIERVRTMLDAGHRLYGENRVQDAMQTWGILKPNYPDICLHLIGPLQTNKVKEAVSFFDVIETVDRPKLVKELAKEMQKQERHIPCFIQVNTGEEKQKSGILPADLPALLTLANEEELRITGLMCIPPADEPPALHFAFLKKLADENNLKELSMGMSHDFEKAIPLGASYIRVGTALFGERPHNLPPRTL